MKNIIKISLTVLAVALSSQAFADDFDGLTCSGKKSAIQTQIDNAKKANNVHKQSGLEKALSDVLAYCSNDDLEKKYQDKIQDKLDDIEKRQEELEEAKTEGKLEKIAKQEAKLKTDEAELKEAQDKLDAFYNALKAEVK